MKAIRKRKAFIRGDRDQGGRQLVRERHLLGEIETKGEGN